MYFVAFWSLQPALRASPGLLPREDEPDHLQRAGRHPRHDEGRVVLPPAAFGHLRLRPHVQPPQPTPVWHGCRREKPCTVTSSFGAKNSVSDTHDNRIDILKSFSMPVPCQRDPNLKNTEIRERHIKFRSTSIHWYSSQHWREVPDQAGL